METVLTVFSGVGGAVISTLVLIVLLGAIVLMWSSRKLGETT